jgi:hypothetical protein
VALAAVARSVTSEEGAVPGKDGDLRRQDLRIAAAYGEVLRLVASSISQFPRLELGQKGDVIEQNAELAEVTGSNDDLHLVTHHRALGSYHIKLQKLVRLGHILTIP